MKKTSKILFGTLSLAAVIGGVYSLYKKRVNQAADFEDFEDSEEDEFELEEDLVVDPENREYVSINITSESSSDSDESEDADEDEEAPKKETVESTVETVVLEKTAPEESETSTKDKESETDKPQE